MNLASLCRDETVLPMYQLSLTYSVNFTAYGMYPKSKTFAKIRNQST